MKTRNRTASVAIAVLAIGLSAATAGCGKYSFNNLKATLICLEGFVAAK